LKSINEIISELFPKKNAVFVSGAAGVTSLQQELRRLKLQLWQVKKIEQKEYEKPNGVFLRFSINGIVHSGIIQAMEENETREMLLTIPPKLQKEGVEVLTILKLPLDRIPLFPFFAILDSEGTEIRKKLAKQYWGSFKDDAEALEKWYKDLLGYRRELVAVEFPQLEPAVPSWISKLEVFVLYNEKDRTIATRYYRSTKREDQVIVNKTSESLGSKTEVFSKVFSLPPIGDALSEGIRFDVESEKIYLNWEHPFFSGVDELKKEIKNFNRAQRGILFDAYKISDSFAFNWTYKEISKRRELAARFPFLKEMFQNWLQPVQVIVRYFIDGPIEGRVTGGHIAAIYVHGSKDQIVVEKVKKREDATYDEKLAREYFPTSVGKPFYGFRADLLHYLSGKLGADY